MGTIVSDFFSNGAVLSFVGTIVLGILGFLFTKLLGVVKDSKILTEIVDGIRTGINVVYNQVILPKLEAARAAGSEEGEKISKKERSDLLRAAWSETLIRLTGPAKDKLIKLGFDWFSAKVEDILMSIKAKSAEAKATGDIVLVGAQASQAPQTPQV